MWTAWSVKQAGEAARCHAHSLSGRVCQRYPWDTSLVDLPVLIFFATYLTTITMEESTSPPPAPRYQNFRSTVSVNWRMKDVSPRPEQPQARTRSNRDRTDSNQNSNAQTYSRNRNAQQSGDDATAGKRLYVGNLLYTAQRTDIEDLFKGYGFNVASVSISTDPFTGRNPSYCFVDLDSAEEAQRAMSELNGVDVLGRPLRVSPGVAKRSGQGGEGGGTETRTKDYERGPGQSRGVRETREQKGQYHRCHSPSWLLSLLRLIQRGNSCKSAYADNLFQTENTIHPLTGGIAPMRNLTGQHLNPKVVVYTW